MTSWKQERDSNGVLAYCSNHRLVAYKDGVARPLFIIVKEPEGYTLRVYREGRYVTPGVKPFRLLRDAKQYCDKITNAKAQGYKVL